MARITGKAAADGPASPAGGRRSPLGGWPGGKFRLADRIAALMPEHRAYCEVFCGAAWLLFRKEREPRECLNDHNGELVNFFEVVRDRAEELCARADCTFSSRQLYEAYLARPLAGDADPVERAFRFYYLHRLSWRGLSRVAGQPAGASFDSGPGKGAAYRAESFQARVRAASRRLAHVTLERLPWEKLLGIYDQEGVFLYLDPPYPGSRVDYGQAWTPEAYARLAWRLGRCRALFLLSIRDTEDMRRLFAGFHIREVSTSYSIARLNGSGVRELLIGNYPFRMD